MRSRQFRPRDYLPSLAKQTHQPRRGKVGARQRQSTLSRSLTKYTCAVLGYQTIRRHQKGSHEGSVFSLYLLFGMTFVYREFPLWAFEGRRVSSHSYFTHRISGVTLFSHPILLVRVCPAVDICPCILAFCILHFAPRVRDETMRGKALHVTGQVIRTSVRRKNQKVSCT